MNTGEDEDIDSNISDGDSNAGSVEEGEVGGSAADTEMAEVEDTEDAVEVQDSDGANVRPLRRRSASRPFPSSVPWSDPLLPPPPSSLVPAAPPDVQEDDEVTVKRPVVEQEIDEDFEAQYLAVMQEAAGNRKGPMFQGSAPAAPVLQVNLYLSLLRSPLIPCGSVLHSRPSRLPSSPAPPLRTQKQSMYPLRPRHTRTRRFGKRLVARPPAGSLRSLPLSRSVCCSSEAGERTSPGSCT